MRPWRSKQLKKDMGVSDRGIEKIVSGERELSAHREWLRGDTGMGRGTVGGGSCLLSLRLKKEVRKFLGKKRYGNFETILYVELRNGAEKHFLVGGKNAGDVGKAAIGGVRHRPAESRKVGR